MTPALCGVLLHATCRRMSAALYVLCVSWSPALQHHCAFGPAHVALALLVQLTAQVRMLGCRTGGLVGVVLGTGCTIVLFQVPSVGQSSAVVLHAVCTPVLIPED
jgi:hypothetical protein